MNSYVIIRREYSYLEPVIRSMFEDAKDITIFIDRRSVERNPADAKLEEHRIATDRRHSAPMLDILINMDS